MNDNQQKFADMVQQNKSTIYTVCYMFSKDQDEVNDLFQEVLIRLWQGFANFEGRSDVKTWIYRVALNTCITLDRKKRRHHKERVYMGDDLFSGNLWLEDISYEEIGAIIGITAKNVSVRLYRIREQLKNLSND